MDAPFDSSSGLSSAQDTHRVCSISFSNFYIAVGFVVVALIRSFYFISIRLLFLTTIPFSAFCSFGAHTNSNSVLNELFFHHLFVRSFVRFGAVRCSLFFFRYTYRFFRLIHNIIILLAGLFISWKLLELRVSRGVVEWLICRLYGKRAQAQEKEMWTQIMNMQRNETNEKPNETNVNEGRGRKNWVKFIINKSQKFKTFAQAPKPVYYILN